MADPTPSAGLPGNEWVELRNVSRTPINVKNCRIGDSSGESGPMPDFQLLPDSFLIVSPTAANADMSIYGHSISVSSFPSLDNDGDQVLIRSPDGSIIHAIAYTSGWYQNELKKGGGWTLEMIDPKTPCRGMNNWRGSIAMDGGTPGKINSNDGVTVDLDAPKLKNAYLTDNETVVLVFDEPLDSLSSSTVSNYAIDGALSIQSVIPLSPLFDQVQIKTNKSLADNTIYTIRVQNVKDCKANTVDTYNKVVTGIPVDPSPGELIINEILFNPRSNAYDYVEFYNNSQKIFDASKVYIANRNGNGVIGSLEPLNKKPFYIFPGDHVVETEDDMSLVREYLVMNPEKILLVSSAPSFPDDEGDIVLVNFQGLPIDEVNYKDDWHFKLIDRAEGVALERVDPSGPSQNSANWHSAASTVGYGTPTYRNSQSREVNISNGSIEVVPQVFSPDNDGFNDIASVRYNLPEPGYIANITIFDALGRPVRNLVRNGTLAIVGYWNWDGLDDRGSKLSVGVYIISMEIFNLNGKKKSYKKTIVLARKMG